MKDVRGGVYGISIQHSLRISRVFSIAAAKQRSVNRTNHCSYKISQSLRAVRRHRIKITIILSSHNAHTCSIILSGRTAATEVSVLDEISYFVFHTVINHFYRTGYYTHTRATHVYICVPYPIVYYVRAINIGLPIEQNHSADPPAKRHNIITIPWKPMKIRI